MTNATKPRIEFRRPRRVAKDHAQLVASVRSIDFAQFRDRRADKDELALPSDSSKGP